MGCFIKFSSPAISFMFLSLLLIPTSAHVQVNEGGYISAVISKKGLDFFKNYLINKATSSIIPLELPDIEKSKKIPLIGKVHMALSNIIIYSVEIDSSYVETGDTDLLLAVSGATADCSMNWEYSYGSWLLPTISDSGAATVLVEGLEVGLTVSLKEQGGIVKVILVDCGSHVRDISIKVDGGASWLYQALFEAFEGKIKSAVESAVTKKISELITKLDSIFQSLPKQIPVSDIASMNTSFVRSPVLSDSSVEVEINGLFTASSGTSMLNYYHKGFESSASCSSPAKMIGIQLNENVFSSGALVYFNANRLHWIIDDIPEKSVLNTSGWRHIIPQLYTQYPNDGMNLYISVTSPPKIHVSEHDIGGTIDLDMTIIVLDSSEVIPVACISLVINTSCFPQIKGDNLAGVIKLNDFKASLTWSRIGNLNMHIFQSMMSTILKTGFLPYINAHLRRGFPLPLPSGFTLENAEIFCTNSWVVVCSDLAALSLTK